jgi:Ca2+-binding RTX toxin-like protein
MRIAYVLVLASIVPLRPAPAMADGATCVYSPVTSVLAVSVTPSDDFAPALFVDQGGNIQISDADGGSDCGVATVTNTDIVTIANTSTTDPFGPFHVTQVPAFAPGSTDEPGSSDEIEFFVDLGTQGGAVHFNFNGSATPIDVAAGGNLINLNAAESDGIDADVTVTGSAGSISLLDSSFADVIDFGGGGPGVAAGPFNLGTHLGGFVLDTGADVIVGGANDDELFGAGGEDLLEGRSGDDDLSGAGGDDVLRGGPGADSMTGLQGADSVSGGSGADDVFGQGGPDLLRGNGGPDQMHGGPAADQMFGQAGADVLDGDGGNDLLNGGPGNDVCFGGPGIDTFAPSCENATQ